MQAGPVQMDFSSGSSICACYFDVFCRYMYGTRLHVLIPLSRQARADPDLPVRAGALFRSIELVSRATLRLRKVGRWRGMGSGTG